MADILTLRALAQAMRARYPQAIVRISEPAGAVCFSLPMAGAGYASSFNTFVRDAAEWQALQRDVDAALGITGSVARLTPFGGRR